MKHRSNFLTGLIAGISASIDTTPNYPKLVGTDTERLQGDVRRVGEYFSTVIDRKNDERKTK
jgi:hypothetical protein